MDEDVKAKISQDKKGAHQNDMFTFETFFYDSIKIITPLSTSHNVFWAPLKWSRSVAFIYIGP